MKRSSVYMQRSALSHKKQILIHNLGILNRKKGREGILKVTEIQELL